MRTRAARGDVGASRYEQMRRIARLLVTAVVLAGLLTGCAAESARPDPGQAFLAGIIDTADPVTLEYGFTVVDASPSTLAEVGTQQRALVWLGGYDNVRCRPSVDDAEIRAWFAVDRLARSPKVAGYLLADEPNTDRNCPSAPTDLRRRSALVRDLDPDPAHPTYATIDDPGQFTTFRDSVDVIVTDPYPCRQHAVCDWSLIPRRIAALRAAGITRYVGMLQLFADDQWRWPTPAELSTMITQWQHSDWEGQLTFSWSYAGGRLTDHPELLDVLRRFNAAPRAPLRP